ncbi:TPA: helix-turn-helix domain-containing protein [Clostridium perfringens]|nr:helix-turn-helix domain-containing protein [Clostridium perfringens]
MKLYKKENKIKDEDYWYKEKYKEWKKNMSKSQLAMNFFMLYKNFDEYLKEISSGALKLYLYYGFHSKNETGESWHSIETISKYFEVSERTINNWNKELIDKGLIFRNSKDNRKNKITYLLPLSTTCFEVKDINELESEEFLSVFGHPIKGIHLFQFRKDKTEKYTEAYHIFFVIYEKKFLDGRKAKSAVHVDINKEKYDLNKIIDEENFYEDICLFKSDFKLGLKIKKSLKFEGIAVNTKINLKNKKDLYDLINQILDPETDLERYKFVKLISNSN